VRDLQLAMAELHDQFRDEETVELRELQRELEATAKACRIAQFKLRKADRRCDQLDAERAQAEDRLRCLENCLQGSVAALLPAAVHVLRICFSAPDSRSRAEYCDERVCLSLCVFVRGDPLSTTAHSMYCVFVCPRSYLRNYTSDLHQIFVHVTYGRGSDLHSINQSINQSINHVFLKWSRLRQ